MDVDGRPPTWSLAAARNPDSANRRVIHSGLVGISMPSGIVRAQPVCQLHRCKGLVLCAITRPDAESPPPFRLGGVVLGDELGRRQLRIVAPRFSHLARGFAFARRVA